ncbi:hypothetical protein BJ166DRAFT_505666 [Pestalotiopsis sp. NC0098]|nr:hypothetical protein BJ166DRAFT_505666 [Pestalotiopsis sp. NC0098]
MNPQSQNHALGYIMEALSFHLRLIPDIPRSSSSPSRRFLFLYRIRKSKQNKIKTNMATKPPRFPSDQDTPEKAEAFAEVERIVKELHGPSFKVKNDDGNFLGPFSVLAAAPKTFAPYLEYTVSFIKVPYLTAKERELAILAAVSVTKSAYVEMAHRKIGIAQGLSETQVERASNGILPIEGLSDREESLYELSLRLARGFGKIDDERFDAAVTLLGREGVSQVAQLVGGYMLVSLLVSVADI